MDKYGLYPDFKVVDKIADFVESEKIRYKTSYVSSLSGSYKSRYKSSGLIFDNIRRYQFGDDKRRIDWKASARTGKLYVKEFIEERNTELLLVLNNSSEMFFASKYQFKSYIALEVFIFLASLALSNKDYVRPCIFNSDTEEKFFNKTNVKEQIFHIVAELHKQNPVKDNYLANLTLLQKLVNRDFTNQNIFLILPIMYDFNDDYKDLIRRLNVQNQLSFIFVWDDLECNLPYLNNLEVRNSSNATGYLVSSNRLSKNKYRDIFTRKKQEIDEFLARNNINHLYLNTKDQTLKSLLEYFTFN